MCRRQAELSVIPRHNWTHELRMWWNGEVRARTRGTGPEPPEPPVIGTSSTAIGLAGAALSFLLLADKFWKEEADDAK